jgi:hypothetical protein
LKLLLLQPIAAPLIDDLTQSAASKHQMAFAHTNVLGLRYLQLVHKMLTQLVSAPTLYVCICKFRMATGVGYKNNQVCKHFIKVKLRHCETSQIIIIGKLISVDLGGRSRLF